MSDMFGREQENDTKWESYKITHNMIVGLVHDTLVMENDRGDSSSVIIQIGLWLYFKYFAQGGIFIPRLSVRWNDTNEHKCNLLVCCDCYSLRFTEQPSLLLYIIVCNHLTEQSVGPQA